MRVSPRLGAAVVAALTIVAVTGTPAVAAPPTNDVYGGAETVAAVPFSTTLNTTEATTDAVDDELNTVCGAPAMDASAWYSFTPDTDDAFLADASASNYSAGVFVATGAPGSFEVLACGPEFAAWQATAGETYSVVVIDDQTDGAGIGGEMRLSLDVAPPPPALEVTVDSTARFDSKTGTAILTGTILCGEDAEFAFLEAQLTQRVGRLLVRGFGGTDVTCDGTARPWTLEVIGDNGLFKGGKTASVTFAAACGAAFCSEYVNESTIQLKGRR
ncbi:DUF6299 family protein [Knoellia aerolata]|uniref:DUF6299 domain-containing protein n=1 Tax=Knoellia aerolata DSM 18566 TaxID=1385519 RepID=A0A0A0JRR3_9MICO|nr:DUF6299 family protein [Knoellia aerolata]KGN40120.1 hypothetical protein N801_08185 [Knoellia aerolata DSM 18566]